MRPSLIALAIGLIAPVAASRADAIAADDDIPSIPAFEAAANAEEPNRSRYPQVRLETHGILRDWRASTLLPAAETPSSGLRTVIDMRGEWALSPTWRAQLSDRIEHLWNSGASIDSAEVRNSLREAYLSGGFEGYRHLDIGRMNLRQGVASGYNPTDFFRGRAVVSTASEDPATKKENRIGTVAIRAQQLWEGFGASLAWSPKLATATDDTAAFADDLGRTNRQQRLLARLALPTGDTVGAEWLAFRANGEAVQWGTNLTALLGNATVAHLEWAGGSSQSLRERALDLPAPTHWRNRLATGLTYSFANRLVVTLEGQYDGTAFSARDWRDLRQKASQHPATTGAYRKIRGWANAEGVPVTRRALFARMVWTEAGGVDNLELAAIVRRNLDDRSQLLQGEASWHRGNQNSLVLQWTQFTGSARSEYGALANARTLTLKSVWYWR